MNDKELQKKIILFLLILGIIFVCYLAYKCYKCYDSIIKKICCIL